MRAVGAGGRRVDRRSGEALGDGQPLLGRVTLAAELRVGTMAALRDQQAEVLRPAAHPVGIRRRAPGPERAVGCVQRDVRHHGRHRPLAVDKTPAEGGDTDVRDVLEPRCRCALTADHVPDVLAVGPGFHQARTGKRARAHGRAIPGQARFRVKAAQRLHQPFVQAAPMQRQRSAVEMTVGGAGNRADRFAGGHARVEFGHVHVEGLRLGGRLQRRRVEAAQVCNLVPGRPAEEAAARVLLRLRQRQRVTQIGQGLVLAEQVATGVLHGGVFQWCRHISACRAARSLRISCKPRPLRMTLTARAMHWLWMPRVAPMHPGYWFNVRGIPLAPFAAKFGTARD